MSEFTKEEKKFTQEEETQIVKGALDLTATIQYEKSEFNKLRLQTFKKMPEPPVRTVLPPVEPVQPQYPVEPRVEYKYVEFIKETLNLTTLIRKIAAVAILIFAASLIGVFLIYSFFAYFKKIKELNDELRNSPEYLAARAEAERIAENMYKEKQKEWVLKQAQLDSEYQKAKSHYDNVVVPEYNKAYEKWSEQRQIKLGILQKEIELNTKTLNDLYDNTKIISISYRELWILDWLYNDMSTSDHGIRYATELLDRDRQRKATEEGAKRTQGAIARMERSMVAGFNAVYNAVEDGNEIQEDILSKLSKVRRDNNIAHFVGAVQRHKTNKMMKEML